MRRIEFIRGGLIAACAIALSGAVLAADSTPAPGPGWTGLTKPQDMITARQELMEHIEILMEPIDTIQVKDTFSTEQLHLNAETIAAMLLALPHLFPPTTNLYDPQAKIPVTLALPPIWKNFDSFYQLAGAASNAAERMSTTTGKDKLRAASLALRASCDACHALYLRPYSPPKVLDSDYKFDFNSVLRKK
ncbi:MAG TPA: cytochrome c [Steroidobacteraceae bacterium]|nr:cytochrome c [Steroidobacteraceae bacterium]